MSQKYSRAKVKKETKVILKSIEAEVIEDKMENEYFIPDYEDCIPCFADMVDLNPRPVLPYAEIHQHSVNIF